MLKTSFPSFRLEPLESFLTSLILSHPPTDSTANLFGSTFKIYLKPHHSLPPSQLPCESQAPLYLNQNYCHGLPGSFLLTFSVYTQHIGQNDPLKCLSNDVIPCLYNFHWLSISLGVKANVLPKSHTALHDLHPTLLSLCSYLLQFSLPLISSYSGLFSVAQKCQTCRY